MTDQVTEQDIAKAKTLETVKGLESRVEYLQSRVTLLSAEKFALLRIVQELRDKYEPEPKEPSTDPPGE